MNLFKSQKHPRHPSRKVQRLKKIFKELRELRKLRRAVRGGREVRSLRYLSYTYVGPPEEVVGSGLIQSKRVGGTIEVPGLVASADTAAPGSPYVCPSPPVALETQRFIPWRPAQGWPGFRSLIPKVFGVTTRGGLPQEKTRLPRHSRAKVGN